MSRSNLIRQVFALIIY